MVVNVYRDFTAIHFIRCVTPVTGASINAGGASFTLKGALAKCESESIERGFEILELSPRQVKPIGIAAHVNEPSAYAVAIQEAIETLAIEEIHLSLLMRCCFRFRVRNFTLGLARSSHGYLGLIRGKLFGQPVLAISARSSLSSTLIKVWEEYRKLHFFKPQGAAFKTYTKGNHLFSADEIEKLVFRFEPLFRYEPVLHNLNVGRAERQGRKIVFLTKQGENSYAGD
jgi:hypothetical protein